LQTRQAGHREILEQRVADLQAQYPDGNIPRRDVWGGERIVPQRLEFWQGRADGLQDGFVFERAQANEEWSVGRIQP